MGSARAKRGVWEVAAALALLSLAALLAACGSGDGSGADGHVDAEALPTAVTARVIRAVDGDTALVRLDGATEYVRYIGIDTPETVKPGTPVECGGPAASRFDHRLVDGQNVRLVFDRERRDDYGRLLAYVYAGGRFVNAALMRGGYARPYPFEPNTAHARQFARLADAAGRRGQGLWGHC
jgi:micrococcal nuclease